MYARTLKETMELMNPVRRPLKDSFRFLPSESNKHIDLKFYCCKLLRKQGYMFFTEALLTNGLRPDIFVPTLSCVFEIQCSEKDKSIDLKRENYLGLRVYSVKTKSDIERYLGTNLQS